jgi:hypothetical protein
VNSSQLLKQVLEHVSETPHLLEINQSRRNVVVCPIPFFGNLESATILTIGVNPSDGEFARTRWPDKISPQALHDRLKNYFNNPCKAHPWFSAWNQAFQELGESLAYEKETAAHTDISPRATIPMNRVKDKLLFKQMLETDIEFLFKAIECGKKVKLIMTGGKVLGEFFIAQWIRKYALKPIMLEPIKKGFGATSFYKLKEFDREITVFSSSVSPGFHFQLLKNVRANREELRKILQ